MDRRRLSPRGRSWRLRLVLVTAMILWSLSATASDDGGDCIAVAGQCVAAAPTAASVFHNPARLPLSVSRFRVGMVGGTHAVAMSGCKEPLCGGYRRPEGLTAVQAGWSTKLTTKLGVGVGLHTPTATLVRIVAAESSAPHWPLLDGYGQRFRLQAGFGYRLHPTLSLGVAAHIFASIGSRLTLATSGEQVDRAGVVIQLGPTVRAIAALHWRPTTSWSLALVWRQATGVPYVIPAEVAVTSLARADLTLSQIAHSTPGQLDLAAGWRRPWGGVEAGIQWSQWSRLEEVAPTLRVATSGALIDGLGLNQVTSVAPTRGWPALRDTLAIGLSAWRNVTSELSLRCGWRWRPSPLPNLNQGPLITDQHRLAVGAALDITGPWRALVSGQWIIHPNRRRDDGVVFGGESLIGAFAIQRRL